MTKTTHTFRIIDDRQSRRPSLWKSLLFWTITPGAVFWPGILAQSTAMQWAGFILFLIVTFVIASFWTDDFLTPDEARKRISEIEDS